MPTSFIVLSEVPLETSDARTALEYLAIDPAAEDEQVIVHAVVPADTQRSLIAQVIDSLGIGDLAGAWDAVTERARRRNADSARTMEASGVLATVEDAFTAVGCEVSGSVAEDDPLPAVRELLEDASTQTVVVYSDPQLLEETFAQDWAHRVEDRLDATVLHLYPGSRSIGTA